jgi:hypothetical protein
MDMRFSFLLVIEELKNEPKLHAERLELRSGGCSASDS